MGIKIIKKLNLKRLVPDIKDSFVKPANREEIKEIIQDKIISGNSPVKGFNQYEKYSDKYGKKKGKERPVDMVDSGTMLFNDLKVSKRLGELNVRFDSKIAEYHDDGEGKMPKRKLLPSKSGETFKQQILNKIVRILDRATKKATKKQ